MSRDPLVRLTAIEKSFSEGSRLRRVLERLDLEVAPGERVAILGRSGSGKSTLLHLIAGLERPEAGSIEVAGMRVDALDPEASAHYRSKQVGMVFQNFLLIATLTTWENVLLPLELSGRLGRKALDRAAELLDRLGLSARRNAFPEQLSGGEKQRVAIARALVTEPALLLADEPTGNLDTETASEVLGLLDRTVREQGRTLLLVTHSAEAASLADRVLRLERGRLLPAEAPAATSDSLP